MTNEELFDAYRQVVSQRDQLAAAGDGLWSELESLVEGFTPGAAAIANWKALRGIGSEPPSENWAEC